MPEKRREVRLTAAERDILEKFVAQGTKSARAINPSLTVPRYMGF